MDLIKVMLALYESEINCGMESFWDGGFTVWLGLKSMGDDMEEKNFAVNELAKDAGKWLHDAALKYYPNSIYTMNYNELCECVVVLTIALTGNTPRLNPLIIREELQRNSDV